MTESELILAVGLMVALIALPLLVVGLVRLLVPLRDEPQEPEPQTGPSAEPMTLRDYWEGAVPHLIELRNRLVKSAIGVGLGTAIGFYVVNSPFLLGDTLPNILINQFVPQDVKLQFIGTAEGFVSYMSVAFLIGFAIAIPIVVYQIIAFFSPGLTAREKRVVFTALPFVTELFLAGITFGWAFTIPAATRFLFNYGAGPRIEVRPSFQNFFSTVTTLLLWNGLVFELPAVIYLLARIGIVSAQQLAAARRYAIVIIIIVAAVITPTGDPFNLMLLAIPMYLLYELGVLLARFVPRRDQPETRAPA